VAEDEVLARLTLAEALREAGFRVFEAMQVDVEILAPVGA
jgi:hypothetical protein